MEEDGKWLSYLGFIGSLAYASKHAFYFLHGGIVHRIDGEASVKLVIFDRAYLGQDGAAGYGDPQSALVSRGRDELDDFLAASIVGAVLERMVGVLGVIRGTMSKGVDGRVRRWRSMKTALERMNQLHALRMFADRICLEYRASRKRFASDLKTFDAYVYGDLREPKPPKQRLLSDDVVERIDRHLQLTRRHIEVLMRWISDVVAVGNIYMVQWSQRVVLFLTLIILGLMMFD